MRPTETNERFGSRIGLTVPAPWTVRDSFQAVSPDRRVHVAVSGEPVAAGLTLADYAERYATLTAQRLPAYELDAQESAMLFAGRDAIVRTFSWAAADRPRVTQVQACCVLADRGYVATVTVPASAFADARDNIMGLLGAITISDGGGPGFAVVPADDRAIAIEALDLGVEDHDDDWSTARHAWTATKVPA